MEQTLAKAQEALNLMDQDGGEALQTFLAEHLELLTNPADLPNAMLVLRDHSVIVRNGDQATFMWQEGTNNTRAETRTLGNALLDELRQERKYRGIPMLAWPSRESIIGVMLRDMESEIGHKMADQHELPDDTFHDDADTSLADPADAMTLVPDLWPHIAVIATDIGIDESTSLRLVYWEEYVAGQLREALTPKEVEDLQELGRQALLNWRESYPPEILQLRSKACQQDNLA